MRILVDNNNLLCIENPNIPQLKEYRFSVYGYLFSSFDKWMIVLHKKDIKIVNLKNLGDGMNVIHINSSKNSGSFVGEDFQKAFSLFSSFDEVTWDNYYFLPNISLKEKDHINSILNSLKAGFSLTQTAKWICVDWKVKTFDSSVNSILSFLFGLFVIYGKWDKKWSEVLSLKIQIPLMGQYLKYQELLNLLVAKLQDIWIFLKADALPTNTWVVYQISSNDWELLEIFAKWWEPIEKFQQISKRDFTLEMKKALLDFLQTSNEIPSEWKQEVIKKISDWVVKFLVK